MRESGMFASLSSGLLARKGAAKPAMRSQVHGFGQGDAHMPLPQVATEDDLGWNDLGSDTPAPVTPIGAAPGAVLRAVEPAVLRQREKLAAAIDATEADDTATIDSPAAPRRRASPAIHAAGRRAAFTLRVDAERHMRLRLACAMQNRSAQQLVTEALDKLLGDLPGLEDLTRRARRS